MKTVTVEEACRNLSELVHSAVQGEEIAIREGRDTVVLQPVAVSAKNGKKLREALRELQSQSRLTPAQAESYLREVHAERLAHESDDRR